MQTPPGDSSPPPGLFDPSLVMDRAMLHRVYGMSAALLVLGAFAVSQYFGRAGVLGWMIGGGLNLALLATVEWSVVRFISPGKKSLGPVALVSLLKFVFVAVVLGLAMVGARQGIVSVLWLAGGFVLPHVVLVLKVLGRLLTHNLPKGLK